MSFFTWSRDLLEGRERRKKNDALVRLALRYNSYTKTFVLNNTMIVNFVKY
jgi:hypothetical protein